MERIRNPGEFVEDSEILSLAQIDPLNVEVVLPLDLFGRVRIGMDASVALGGPVAGTYDATVTVVDPVVDAASGTFRARLQIPNEDLAIPSGLRCDVRFGFES